MTTKRHRKTSISLILMGFFNFMRGTSVVGQGKSERLNNLFCFEATYKFEVPINRVKIRKA
jgi:hypothetical protein